MHFGPDARSSPKDICERWLSFDNFLSDVGLKPEPTNEFRIVRIRESRPWRKDLAHVMDRADVGMVQRRGSLRFALEARQRLGISGHVFGQELESDKTVKARVLSLVDHSHASAAEHLDYAVVGDSGVDHVPACWA